MEVSEGHVLADRYVVGRRLSSGGAGTVHAAHDQLLDRPVAVKLVHDPAAAQRLAREARAAAGVQHPNVVAVYDAGGDDAGGWLVMELVDGTDLGALLIAGPLEPELTAVVGHDLARGLAALHDAGLVHRDVTPGNVLVTRDGRVVLGDLGIARRLDDESARLTVTGTIIGTVDFLAPEQVADEEVGPAADVYALGLVLHAARTAAPPFGTGTAAERTARRLTAVPARLDGGGRLDEVVVLATRLEPDERPADGAAVRDLLATCMPADVDLVRARLAARVVAADQGPRGATTTVVPAPAPDDDQDATRVLPRGAPPVDAAGGGPGDATSPPGRTTSELPVDTTSDLAADPEMAREAEEPDGRMRGPLAFAAGLLVVAIGLAGAASGGGDGTGGGGSGDGDGGGTGGDASRVAVATVLDHDPLGGGGEHGDTVGLAVDDDPDSAWDTEGYASADLGGLKTGVGLLVDLGGQVDVATVELRLPVRGVDVTVAVHKQRPDGDPTGTGTVLGEVSDAGGQVTVGRDRPTTGRWLSVWFTRLGPDGGRFRGAVADLVVRAS